MEPEPKSQPSLGVCSSGFSVLTLQREVLCFFTKPHESLRIEQVWITLGSEFPVILTSVGIFSARGSSSWGHVLKANRFSPQMRIACQGGNSIFPEGLTTGTVGGHSLARLQTRETSSVFLSV